LKNLVVMKFGGSSLRNPHRIRRVARTIVGRKRGGELPLAVVSAMGDQTDRLLGMARDITGNPRGRELDMLLTAGERISMALLAMAIRDQGEEALSFTGSQIGLITDTVHNRARIIEIRPFRLVETLEAGRIPIVAGFQGVSSTKEVTTLGRGGSDLTAVALARFFGDAPCEIYTDVAGVFGCDPRRFKGAKKWETISYHEMLELSDCGAQVIHPRAVALAARGRLPVRILSSLKGGGGTVIKEEKLEEPRITGLTKDEVVLFEIEIKNREEFSQWMMDLAQSGVKVKLLSCDRSGTGERCSLLISKEDEELAADALEEAFRSLESARWSRSRAMSRISLVGYGVGDSPLIVKEFLEAFHEAKAPVRALQVTSLRLSGITGVRQAGRAMKTLARKYALAG
jgi:aspartate kinase